MPKRPKCVVVLLLILPRHTLFTRDFSGNIEDTDIINTPLESLRPADVHFGVLLILLPILGVKYPPKPLFLGVNTRFQAKRAKY